MPKRQRRRPAKARAYSTPMLAATPLRADWLDCQRVPVSSAATTEPEEWAQAIFHNLSPLTVRIIRLRDRVVARFGLKLEATGSFPIIWRGEREVLVGSDDRHLDFRASVHRTDNAVEVVTIVQTHNLLGRIYLLPVRMVHGAMLRRMMLRAARQLDS